MLPLRFRGDWFDRRSVQEFIFGSSLISAEVTRQADISYCQQSDRSWSADAAGSKNETCACREIRWVCRVSGLSHGRQLLWKQCRSISMTVRRIEPCSQSHHGRETSVRLGADSMKRCVKSFCGMTNPPIDLSDNDIPTAQCQSAE